MHRVRGVALHQAHLLQVLQLGVGNAGAGGSRHGEAVGDEVLVQLGALAMASRAATSFVAICAGVCRGAAASIGASAAAAAVCFVSRTAAAVAS